MHRVEDTGNQRYQLRQAAGAYWLLDMSQSGEYFRKPMQLNETGARLYIGLAAGKTTEELAQELAAAYDMPADDMLEDVKAFEQTLRKQGII